MALYTRCPACKSEIAFEPPKNIANLPEDYKHRIKCPSCGVTIGVRLNIIERQPVGETPLALQPIEDTSSLSAQYNTASNTVPARSLDKRAKKKGTGRNIMMMLFALLFIALGAISYLVANGTLGIGEKTYGLDSYSAIEGWKTLVTDFDTFKATFEFDTVYGIMCMMPMISFTLAGVTFIVALISACGKKYGRAFNFIWSLLVFAVGVMVIFAPMIQTNISGNMAGASVELPTYTLSSYFKYIFDAQSYCIFAPAVLGFLQFLFSLFFLKSLKVKPSKRD